MPRTVEARRLAELARAAGLDVSPGTAVAMHRTAIELLGDDGPSPLLVDVLRWQGSVLSDQGRTAEADALYRRSYQMAVALDYDPGCAHGLNAIGVLAQRRGDITKAANDFSDALVIAERCGETRLVGMLQQNLGVLADIRGNPAAALAHYRVALRTFQSANDRQRESWVLSNLGYLHAKEGRFDDARDAYDRALRIVRDRGDLLYEGIIEENRGELELMVGDVDRALPSIQRALAVAEQREDAVRRAAALKLLGAHHRMSNRPAAAQHLLSHALTLSAIAEDALLGAELLFQFGCAIWEGGDEPLGRDVLRTAADAFDRIGARQWLGRVRTRLSGGASGRYF